MVNAIFPRYFSSFKNVPDRNWGGQRLASGRKPKLENQTIEQVKRYAASTLLKLLRDKNTDLELRADISTKVFLKAMPAQITSDGSLATQVVQVYFPTTKEVLVIDNKQETVIPCES